MQTYITIIIASDALCIIPSHVEAYFMHAMIQYVQFHHAKACPIILFNVVFSLCTTSYQIKHAIVSCVCVYIHNIIYIYIHIYIYIYIYNMCIDIPIGPQHSYSPSQLVWGLRAVGLWASADLMLGLWDL